MNGLVYILLTILKEYMAYSFFYSESNKFVLPDSIKSFFTDNLGYNLSENQMY